MKKLWWVAYKDLQLLFKDRIGLVWIFALPLVVMVVVGFSLGSAFGGGDSTSQLQLKLPIVDLDRSSQSQALVSAFKSVPILVIDETLDEATARKLVDQHDRGGAVIIPAGFGQAATSQTKTNVIILTDPSDRTQAAILQSVTDAIVTRYLFTDTAIKASINEVQKQAGTGAKLDYAAIAQSTGQFVNAALSQPSISVKQETTAPRKINQFDQLVPGYAVMFMLFGISAAAATILQEKESGTFRRLLTSPISKWSLLGGKLVAQFIVAFCQVVIMFLVGWAFFGLKVNNPLALLLIIVVTVFSATAFGMLLVSIVKSRAQLSSIGTVVVLTFSALGGSWFPLFLMPDWVQGVSKITLTSWSMTAFNDLIIFGRGFEQILPTVGFLFLYGIICFLIGIRLFKFKSA